MPQTPNWQLPYPAEADPADVPADIQKLAVKLDALLTQVKAGGAIPGELKMWSGVALPDVSTYGHWVWADGAAYDGSVYPIAAANIAPAWKTHAGKVDPGAGLFRVPDLRGSVPTGLDGMPGGARASRISRALAATIAAITGEEVHSLAVAEMPAHAHTLTDPKHGHPVSDPTHRHPLYSAAGVLLSGNAGDQPGTTLVDDSQVWSGNVPANSAYAGNTPTGVGVVTAATGISVNNNGGGGAHENLPPTVFVPYICKLDD